MRIIRAALLHYDGQVRGARLRNISSGGALVECREEVAVGADIQLDFAAGGLIDAKVVLGQGHAVRLSVQGKVQPQAAAGCRRPFAERREGHAAQLSQFRRSVSLTTVVRGPFSAKAEASLLSVGADLSGQGPGLLQVLGNGRDQPSRELL